MAIDLYLPGSWRRHGLGSSHLIQEPGSLDQILTELERSYPLIRTHWRQADGRFVDYLQLFVNGVQVALNPLPVQPLHDGDAIDVVLPISGG
jgi:molybdopterin converting factor small subunit